VEKHSNEQGFRIPNNKKNKILCLEMGYLVRHNLFFPERDTGNVE